MIAVRSVLVSKRIKDCSTTNGALMSLTTLTRAVAMFGGLFSLAMVLYAADLTSVLLVLLMFVFGAWAVAPFCLAYFRASSFSNFRIASILLLLATVAAAAFSVYVYWTTFVDNSNPDAQDGLVLVVVPLYQIIGMGVALAAATVASKYVD